MLIFTDCIVSSSSSAHPPFLTPSASFLHFLLCTLFFSLFHIRTDTLCSSVVHSNEPSIFFFSSTLASLFLFVCTSYSLSCAQRHNTPCSASPLSLSLFVCISFFVVAGVTARLSSLLYFCRCLSPNTSSTCFLFFSAPRRAQSSTIELSFLFFLFFPSLLLSSAFAFFLSVISASLSSIKAFCLFV